MSDPEIVPACVNLKCKTCCSKERTELQIILCYTLIHKFKTTFKFPYYNNL